MNHFLKNGMTLKDGSSATVSLKAIFAPTDASKTDSASSAYSINDKLKAPVSKRMLKAPLLSEKTLSNLKWKADENGSQLSINVPSKRDQFYEAYRRQLFSLPDSVIYYATKNPSSPELYQKMIQTCKYFYIKNPIFVVPHLFFQCKENKWNISSYTKLYDFKNASNKIWVKDQLDVNIKFATEQNPFLSIIPKLYSYEIRRFSLYNQNMFFNDFVLLASKCKVIYFNKAFISNEDGSVVALEKVIESLPNVTNFYHEKSKTSNMFTSNTVSELFKLSHFLTLTDFNLSNVSEVFDIDLFYGYIKKNKKTRISLNFCNELSDGYKARLQTIVDDILAAIFPHYKVPRIDFHGIDPLSRILLMMY